MIWILGILRVPLSAVVSFAYLYTTIYWVLLYATPMNFYGYQTSRAGYIAPILWLVVMIPPFFVSQSLWLLAYLPALLLGPVLTFKLLEGSRRALMPSAVLVTLFALGAPFVEKRTAETIAKALRF